ncbi:hypothetical protein C7418_0713 [Cupriavidus plantarum]|nr:hypothetical protein C7418_0713 [Cupriavidus plantarum]
MSGPDTRSVRLFARRQYWQLQFGRVEALAIDDHGPRDREQHRAMIWRHGYGYLGHVVQCDIEHGDLRGELERRSRGTVGPGQYADYPTRRQVCRNILGRQLTRRGGHTVANAGQRHADVDGMHGLPWLEGRLLRERMLSARGPADSAGTHDALDTRHLPDTKPRFGVREKIGHIGGVRMLANRPCGTAYPDVVDADERRHRRLEAAERKCAVVRTLSHPLKLTYDRQFGAPLRSPNAYDVPPHITNKDRKWRPLIHRWDNRLLTATAFATRKT